MTVRELIEVLMDIQNQDLPVVLSKTTEGRVFRMLDDVDHVRIDDDNDISGCPHGEALAFWPEPRK